MKIYAAEERKLLLWGLGLIVLYGAGLNFANELLPDDILISLALLIWLGGWILIPYFRIKNIITATYCGWSLFITWLIGVGLVFTGTY